MCEAIVNGIMSSYPGISISISEIYDSRCAYLRTAFPVAYITSSNQEVLHNSDVVVISVKPQQLESALKGLGSNSDQLFISICAGVTLSRLEGFLTESTKIVRVMPNLAAMVGEGASGFCMNRRCSEADAATVKNILGSVGQVVEQVPEGLMDVVTGVSGSGPAFVSVFIEALADAGVRHGLSRETAVRLAAQTCVGAGKLVLSKGESSHPAIIKDKVCSPGGTSIAGVTALEQNGFRAATIAAVSAAIERGQQLGKL
jgi:pyrroline-5-carboxylate reductase